MGEPEIGAGGVLTVLAIAAVGLLIVILPFWAIFRKAGLSPFLSLLKIVSKAGYHGAWSLVGLVPLVNVVMLYIFAFSDWPALKRRRLQASGGGLRVTLGSGRRV